LRSRHAYPDESDLPSRPLRSGTLRRVWGLFTPYRLQLVIVMILVLASAGLGIALPLLIARVIDVAIPTGDRDQLILLVAIMVATTALSGALSLIQTQLNTTVGLRVMQDLRQAVYQHLQRLPLRFFTSTRTGDIQTRLASDVAGTQAVLTDTVSNLVSNSAVVVSSVIAMLIISWQLSLVALGIIPFFVLFTVRVGRRRRVLTRDTQRSLADLTAMTGETLSVSGIVLAKTFAREAEHREKFERNNRQLTELSIRQQLVGRVFFVVIQTFFGIAPAAVWLIGGFLLTGGSTAITIGEVVAFTTLQTRLLFPLAGLLNRGVEVSGALALFERIFEYMDTRPEIVDPSNPVHVDPAGVRGEVRFEKASFAYEPRAGSAGAPVRPAESDDRSQATEREVPFALEEVDFVAEPGRLTALVGPSGSGKTTAGYLLVRLYDVSRGRVLIDGVDVRQMALANLNRIVGVVTQDTFLFHASVADNLRYGRPQATDDEIVEAARAAQIHETIMAMPDGYQTVVGERGYRMSGGERQRIAIGRVILADPRILLLDEATSSLDSISERLIQDALSRLMRGRTTIAIAHRLSTVLAADCILVMEHGRIADRGRHGQLIETSDTYRRLYREQFGVPEIPASR